ncbi:MAG: type II toxin-antitoxin system VapC family toxin [Chloroflexi bacterium]|nr:type II toxin-antitoxin system VapC family toxin [Chloroflexota bacterium]
MAVIDASVYVALVSEHEEAHKESWDWFQQAITNQEKIIAPAIILAEVGAAISRGVDDPSLAHRIVQELEISKIIQITPIPLPLAKRAAAIAIDNKIRGCDAIYVALAEREATSLITLDRQQLERSANIVMTKSP